jgi:uncharacterized protein (DUF2062 family)
MIVPMIYWELSKILIKINLTIAHTAMMFTFRKINVQLHSAIAGGLIIGVAQELSVPFFGSEYKLAVALVIMIIILLVRPQGIFSK